MDIPETGAIFTLGKSYLSENHQSYFFIKNDPIRKVVTGDNQSAVICESGRLFVFGENQYGQLSAGKEVIAKPSCVKEIKNLGYKVRTIAFSDTFSVILTENNKIFFNGKSIFGNTTQCIIRHNYEIIDFHKRCLDDQGNFDDLVDIAAGRSHFVVLTNSGKLYCYGCFDSFKVKHQSETVRRISEHLIIRIAKCGSTFVVFISDCNGVFVLGNINSVEYTQITKLNKSDLADTIYSLYVSKKDEIFLISSSGDVYKSTNGTEIEFERIILFNKNDNIRKFCAGNDFVCVLTDKNKFLTTFNEKTSAKTCRPHELKKFQNLHILDVAAGLHHILLFAVSIKISPSNSLDITSSDANENILNDSLRKSDSSMKSSEELSAHQVPQNISGFKNIISEKPILAKEILEIVQSDITYATNSINESKVSKIDVKKNSNENKLKAVELVQHLSTEKEIQDSNHLQFNYQADNMDIVSKNISNFGDSLVSDIKSITTAGEEKLNDLTKETEKKLKDVPKNVIDYVKTSVGHEEDFLHANINETNTSDLKISEQKNNAMNENDLYVPRNEDFNLNSVDNDVKFIDNGMEINNTSNIIQAMKDEIDEMSNDVKNKSDELTVKYEGVIDDELSEAKETISSKMFHIKDAADLITKIVPLKHDLEELDLEADGDTEQTTASIKSVNTPAKNQLEIEDSVDQLETINETQANTQKENEGRVKRFFSEIKNNCKSSDTVIEMEESAMQQINQIKTQSINDIMENNKTSKVCTIL
ncbi:uncharacterized protein LOC116347879 isoform X2 [Contarinia nasturtii]|uniref:uncharacterized protein LOC116347879 isoform X2 n=1 Tax=Contarinia nasturtii TaxID=265458 RepID=UPI0012D43F6B|nr:uncharacterized protein LOC116347879 isoform X2 [Contarinia nasturtii]